MGLNLDGFKLALVLRPRVVGDGARLVELVEGAEAREVALGRRAELEILL